MGAKSYANETVRGSRGPIPPRIVRRLAERTAFAALQTCKVDAPCDIWLGSETNSGYGYMNFSEGAGAVKVYAHHLAYRLDRLGGGPLPAEMVRAHAPKDLGALHRTVVCHRCDVHMCVNPEHLYLGEGHSNQTDRYARGADLGVREAVRIVQRAHCRELPWELAVADCHGSHRGLFARRFWLVPDSMHQTLRGAPAQPAIPMKATSRLGMPL